jgi:hypothetical protein
MDGDFLKKKSEDFISQLRKYVAASKTTFLFKINREESDLTAFKI